LFGPIVGTAVFIFVREIVSSQWEHHELIVGLVAILVVIFAPRGLVGLWRDVLASVGERKPGDKSGISAKTSVRVEP
jgi:branched-chain amino acid transport system permease protein